MELNATELDINGIKYVPKGSYQPAVKLGEYPYVVIRADRAGVFAGYLKEKKDTEVTLCQVRRLWYWSGAASCSQLAEQGTSKPTECKFTAPNREITIKNWIEILPATEKARVSIEGVKVWQA